MKKWLISGISSIAIIMNTICVNLTANAKVIEPEIVKTETWTTSYYIDDDMETLYPYIDCQADIYNDGTIKVYFWNTHEWDGFATVSHNITILQSAPVSTDSMIYAFKNNKKYNEYYPVLSDHSKSANYSFWDKQDISFYPKEYKYSCSNNPFFYNSKSICFYYCDGGYTTNSYGLQYFQHRSSLAGLSINEKRTLTFTPQVDPTDSYEFYILGHTMLITPDLLSSSITAQPQIDEKENYINELQIRINSLEDEISELKNENEQLKKRMITETFGDIDGNDIIDGRDATLLLTYYAKTSTGYEGTLEEFVVVSESDVTKSSDDT